MTPAPPRILPLLLLALAQTAWCEQSASPGADPHINQPFASAPPGGWVDVLERPGREVFDQRYRILEAARLEEGMRVADIGAGTGLFATLFARAVGPNGVVYAIDISPGLISALSARARAEGLANLVPIRNTQHDTGLQSAGIDLAFLCDTYHHFEDPDAMLASIHRALVPGGGLIIIDYERLPDSSSPWILSHVRAGRDQVVREVTAAGFGLVEQPEILRESYFLRFQRTGGPAP